MSEKPVTTNRYRPVLGLVSVGLALLALILSLGPIIGLDVLLKLRAPATTGIDGVAGGVNAWFFYILLAIIAAGVVLAVSGLLRGERRRWVHAMSVVLNLGAPVAALGVLVLVFG